MLLHKFRPLHHDLVLVGFPCIFFGGFTRLCGSLGLGIVGCKIERILIDAGFKLADVFFIEL